MTARELFILAAAVATGIAGCGTSPNVNFYSLLPTTGATAAGAPRTIELRAPTIAGYLDRPEIVRRVVDYRVGVASDDRWGEPLDAMIGRVLAEDIQQRSPGSSVFGEGGAIHADADAVVEVEVRRFEVSDDGAVDLIAEVAVERPGPPSSSVVRAVTLRVAPHVAAGTAMTTPVLAAAMSELLGRLADTIAGMLHTPASAG